MLRSCRTIGFDHGGTATRGSMAITEDTGRTDVRRWFCPEKAVAVLIALAFSAVSIAVGALITEALSQLF